MTPKKTIVNPYEYSESEKKGYLFEQWVVGQFPQDKFLLVEWRSDKHCGDVYPVSSRNPDLVIRMFSSTKIKIFFAVECKWRAKIYDGRLDWANIDKRIVYNKFGEKLKIPIHIALGIGGTPDQPEKTYLIPFQKIRYFDFIEQKFLDEYSWPTDFKSMKEYLFPNPQFPSV